MTRDDVLGAFANVRPSGDGWTAKCPAHDDTRNSLSIGHGHDGRWLFRCHAGCTFRAILDCANLALADVLPERTNGRTLAATYTYRDEHGTHLYDVLRFVPKDFRQRAADGSWSLKGVRRVIYRLPDLVNRRTVFVVEGEKDADELWTKQVPATTNCGGAGKWRAEYADQLKAVGCQHVVVLPDNDPPGATHGLTVARSCTDAGLDVKLVPLPGLPPKGDVSDFLRNHTRDELLAIGRDAQLFNPARSVTAPTSLVLTSLADLLAEPDDAIEWVLEPRIPSGAIALLAAPPKTGKSTLARELALAVATGRDFLGWRTTPGPVWYLGFQDKRSEVKRHFRRLGATSTDPVRVLIGRAPADLLAQLQERAAREHPILMIVDMLAQMIDVEHYNDYGEMARAIDPLLQLARTTGASLLLLHHGSAHATREGLDAVLNSTALTGSVDNVLILRRDADNRRVFSSIQRIGPDLEPTVIGLNAETGRLECLGTKRACDDNDLGRKMLAILAASVTPLPEATIQAGLDGRKKDHVRVLRYLVGTRQVVRSGGGKRGNPYVYRVVSGSRDSETTAPTGDPREPEARAIKPDLFDADSDSSFLVPAYSQELENQNPQYVDRHYDLHSSTAEVDRDPIVVPDHPKTDDPDHAGTTNNTDKHCSDSGSRHAGTGGRSLTAQVQDAGDESFRRGWK